jgi:hypothetical protein
MHYDPSRMASSPNRFRGQPKDPSDTGSFTHASEPSPSNRWGATRDPDVSIQANEQQFPVRQVGRTTGPSSTHDPKTTDRVRSHAPRDAPEPDSQYKRTTPPNRAARRHDHTTQDALPEHMIKPNSGHSAIQTKASPAPAVRGSGSHRLKTNDCRRARMGWRQQANSLAVCKQTSEVVETTGIEPVTPCLQSRCSPS